MYKLYSNLKPSGNKILTFFMLVVAVWFHPHIKLKITTSSHVTNISPEINLSSFQNVIDTETMWASLWQVSAGSVSCFRYRLIDTFVLLCDVYSPVSVTERDQLVWSSVQDRSGPVECDNPLPYTGVIERTRSCSVPSLTARMTRR